MKLLYKMRHRCKISAICNESPVSDGLKEAICSWKHTVFSAEMATLSSEGGKAHPEMSHRDTRADRGPLPVGAADRPDLRGFPAQLPRLRRRDADRRFLTDSFTVAGILRHLGLPHNGAAADPRPFSAPEPRPVARAPAESSVTRQASGARTLHPRPTPLPGPARTRILSETRIHAENGFWSSYSVP